MALCDSWFYYPTSKIYDEPSNWHLRAEDIWIDVNASVRLHGWMLPAAEPVRALVVHCHGNAGNITGHFGLVAWMPQAGIDVLCFDYRGYGRSSGKPSRAGTVEDALAATRRGLELAARRGLPVVLFGQSIGGAVAAVVAAQEPRVSGVVLDGAFSSYRREAAWVCRQAIWPMPLWWIAGKWLVSAGYDAIDAVADISPRPLLIMHGKADRIVDWRQSVELYEAAREPKELWLIDHCDHCEVWQVRPEAAQQRFLAFVERSAGRRGGCALRDASGQGRHGER